MTSCPVFIVTLGFESSLIDPKVEIVHGVPEKGARKFCIGIKQLQKKSQDEASGKRTSAALSPVVSALRALRGASFRCECGPARDRFEVCSTVLACFVVTTLGFRTGTAADDVGELVFWSLRGGTILGLTFVFYKSKVFGRGVKSCALGCVGARGRGHSYTPCALMHTILTILTCVRKSLP